MQTVKGPMDAKRAFMQMKEGDLYVPHGKYSVEDGVLLAKLRAPYGVFLVEARVHGDTLALKSVRSGGHQYLASYEFVEVR
jgi:hypothetical protein